MNCADDGGFEPQIGEIRALRTFRVGPGGVLFPLFSRRPWVDGANEAACTVTRDPGSHESRTYDSGRYDSGSHESGGSPAHAPPEPDCTCGFYAYANLSAASEYPYARHVLAVVACWGRVIVGTKGLRAQRARIVAVWLSQIVPADLVRMVAERYPTARIYSDRAAMLSTNAPTALADYELDDIDGPRSRWRIVRILAVPAFAAGLLPTSWIAGLPSGWVAWSAILCVLLGIGLMPPQRPDAVAQRRRLLCLALVLWMIAPFAGLAGTLFLHLPLVQIAVLLSVQKAAMNRIARMFPAPIG